METAQAQVALTLPAALDDIGFIGALLVGDVLLVTAVNYRHETSTLRLKAEQRPEVERFLLANGFTRDREYERRLAAGWDDHHYVREQAWYTEHLQRLKREGRAL